jgi:hypothetical protein
MDGGERTKLRRIGIEKERTRTRRAARIRGSEPISCTGPHAPQSPRKAKTEKGESEERGNKGERKGERTTDRIREKGERRGKN